ncbi:CYTH domain protein [Thalassoglobus neptunius]|uniref:CYTH domain protein n=1 Tax=Thalassoglobus neptunius TaxID=1938619 RepID=A0A5C5WLD3_9PLAN|nr:CYTH domain-containing protein [Thalassoglobus neptunius]TWT51596.1 CYTH domain protein [Thalassoglobus neptunius]
MGIEIERKFLVAGDFRTGRSVPFRQGYLSRDPERTVRVRIAGDRAWLTIKSLTNDTTRQEFEYEVPVSDAEEMLALCDGPLIEKYRWFVDYEGMLWEVDEFLGDNAGLIVAEIELTAEDQPFEKPPWLGDEVTGDRRYHNSSLVKMPFKSWPQ